MVVILDVLVPHISNNLIPVGKARDACVVVVVGGGVASVFGLIAFLGPSETDAEGNCRPVTKEVFQFMWVMLPNMFFQEMEIVRKLLLSLHRDGATYS